MYYFDKNILNLFSTEFKKIKKVIIKKLVAKENLKKIKNVEAIIHYFENKVNKSDLVLTIGGGTISDLISFCCSIYMRGIIFWSIPTTLISQVDALSAGKTCINTNKSKNLIGTFYYAQNVFIIPELVINSSYFNYRQGLSEILKYGLLGNKKIINILYKNSYKNKILNKKLLIKIIKLTVITRAKIAKKNPLASNLGHTLVMLWKNLQK